MLPLYGGSCDVERSPDTAPSDASGDDIGESFTDAGGGSLCAIHRWATEDDSVPAQRYGFDSAAMMWGFFPQQAE